MQDIKNGEQAGVQNAKHSKNDNKTAESNTTPCFVDDVLNIITVFLSCGIVYKLFQFASSFLAGVKA